MQPTAKTWWSSGGEERLSGNLKWSKTTRCSGGGSIHVTFAGFDKQRVNRDPESRAQIYLTFLYILTSPRFFVFIHVHCLQSPIPIAACNQALSQNCHRKDILPFVNLRLMTQGARTVYGELWTTPLVGPISTMLASKIFMGIPMVGEGMNNVLAQRR